MSTRQSVPKYSQLESYFREMMQKGELRPGDQLPSENMLAKQYNLSRHTIRQALGDLENEGLIHREQGKGTFCARNKTNGRIVAVVTTYISEYIFPTVIRGIEEILSAAGCTLLLANTGNDKLKEASCLDNLLQHEIAGIIIEPTKSALDNVNLQYFQEIKKRNIPYLMLHASYPELDSAYIVMDDERGGYMSTQYLLQLGHREIAGIFKSDDLQGVRRQAGFASALKEYGISPRPDFQGNYDTEQMSSYPYQFTRNLLQREERPTAIVCYNDSIAMTVLEAIRDEGLRVPEHISVIGYDDSSLSVASEVKLTTIRHPKAAMGRQAARFILDMLEGSVKKPCLIYQPELVIRASAASPDWANRLARTVGVGRHGQ